MLLLLIPSVFASFITDDSYVFKGTVSRPTEAQAAVQRALLQSGNVTILPYQLYVYDNQGNGFYMKPGESLNVDYFNGSIISGRVLILNTYKFDETKQVVFYDVQGYVFGKNIGRSIMGEFNVPYLVGSYSYDFIIGEKDSIAKGMNTIEVSLYGRDINREVRRNSAQFFVGRNIKGSASDPLYQDIQEQSSVSAILESFFTVIGIVAILLVGFFLFGFKALKKKLIGDNENDDAFSF